MSMRILNVTGPKGLGPKVLDTAFSAGIDKASMRPTEIYKADGGSETYDRVDVETSTPKAKRFIDALLAADFYDCRAVTIVSRESRSIVPGPDVEEVTLPLVEPATDLYEELWQFTHVTYGHVGRVFISACLLAYGVAEAKLLVIIAGLLFLPVLPLISAVSFGLAGRQFRLARMGVVAFAVSIALLFAGGVLIGLVCQPPIKFNELGSPVVGLVTSFGVGIAATLASIDDAGRRELIGLAAASQIGIIPVWLGLVVVLGLPTGESVAPKLFSLAANTVVLMVTLMGAQYATGVVGEIRRVK